MRMRTCMFCVTVTMTCTPKLVPARGDVGDGVVEVVVLVAERAPPVDDQEDVAGLVVRDPAGSAGAAERGHRLEAVLTEHRLALVERGAYVVDRAADALRVDAGGDRGDMR